MATSYLKCKELSEYEPFQRRVEAAMVRSAIDISNEADTVEHHAERLLWGARVTKGKQPVGIFALGIAVQMIAVVDENEPADANALITDGNIEFYRDSIINAYAGV